MQVGQKELIRSLKEIENFSGGITTAYSNEASIRHYVHKILMESLKGQNVYKEEEKEIKLHNVCRRPDMKILGMNKEERYFNIELKNSNESLADHLAQNFEQLRLYSHAFMKKEAFGILTNYKEWFFIKYSALEEFKNLKAVLKELEEDKVHWNDLK